MATSKLIADVRKLTAQMGKMTMERKKAIKAAKFTKPPKMPLFPKAAAARQKSRVNLGAGAPKKAKGKKA